MVCRPTECITGDTIGPAVTNLVTLTVPGYNDYFIWIYCYRSKFNVTSLQNSY